MLLQAAEEHSERERERGIWRRERERGRGANRAASCGTLWQSNARRICNCHRLVCDCSDREGGARGGEKEGGVRQLSAFGCKIKE